MAGKTRQRTKAGVATIIALVVNLITVLIAPYIFDAIGISRVMWVQSLLLGGAAFIIVGSGYLIDRGRSRRDER